MNRRKAISRILLAGAGITLASGGYKWYEINKTPDINFLTANSDLVASLAETIIPSTDTPGAREAGVHSFIIKMIKDCTDRKSQNNFITGLKEIQAHCVIKYGKPYQSCSPRQQETALKYFEKKGKPYAGIIGKAQTRYLGKSFFTTLKEYTVEGFCTSREGATKALVYDYVPGNYHGCIPLKPGQKAWATN
jgi:Gluconate 2-dehydrogenase subunit 3